MLDYFLALNSLSFAITVGLLEVTAPGKEIMIFEGTNKEVESIMQNIPLEFNPHRIQKFIKCS